MEALQKIKKGKYIVEVLHDDSPANPRHYGDNSRLILFHKRYDIGDQHEYKHSDYTNWDDMKEDIIKKEQPGMILPVYMYDHGSVSLSTRIFNDRWDSAQVGFAIIEWSRFRDMTADEGKHSIETELEDYSNYLNGECYMYRISEEQVCNLGCPHHYFIDAGSGYYNEDDCLREGMAQLSYYLQKEEAEA